MIEPKVLKGFKDTLPEDELLRLDLINRLKRTFLDFGFLPIDTPALEYSEVLLGKGGGETDKQIYRFNDHGGRDVALRFDLTVPFARFVAQNRNRLTFPFKRFHIDKVWRGENTQKGRYREFYQCDFDIVGTFSLSSDFEILLLMYTSLNKLGITDFTICFNHRGLFNRFLDTIGCRDVSVEILRCVDKIFKIGRENVREQLIQLTNEVNAGKIITFITAEGSFTETLHQLIELAGGTCSESERLSDLHTLLGELGIEGSFKLTPSITRGLDYYTGIVFETYLTGLNSIGSVCSGGRYDNLTGLYTKEPIPGVGASIGLDRLLAAINELKLHAHGIQATHVIIFNIDEECLGFYHDLSMELRINGVACEVYPEVKKINQQFKYAESLHIPLAIFCGRDEKSSGMVNLRNLETKESLDAVPIKDLSGVIHDMVQSPKLTS